MKLDLDEELQALHDNLLRTNPYYISQQQVFGLVGLLRAGLESPSRPMRILVLRMLVGDTMKHFAGEKHEIKSTKHISGGIASFLIEQLKEPQSKPWRLSRYGLALIRSCETAIKEQVEGKPSRSL